MTVIDGIDYYSVQDMVKRFNIGRTTLYQRIDHGQLTPIKRGKQTLFKKQDVDAYFNVEKPAKNTVICVANQKGGVGKTTITYNLAKGLITRGLKILVIDLDPQANLTTLFLQGKSVAGDNIAMLFEGRAKWRDLARAVDGTGLLTLIPSGLELSRADNGASSLNRFFVIRDLIRDLDNNEFDYTVIDCPPTLGIFSVNALISSEYVLIPVECTSLPMQGLADLISTIKEIRHGHNQRLKILGILINRLHTSAAQQTVQQELKSRYKELVFKAEIPRATVVEESQLVFTSVAEVDPNSKTTTALVDFVDECLERLSHE